MSKSAPLDIWTDGEPHRSTINCTYQGARKVLRNWTRAGKVIDRATFRGNELVPDPVSGEVIAVRPAALLGEGDNTRTMHTCDWDRCTKNRMHGLVYCAEHLDAETERWLASGTDADIGFDSRRNDPAESGELDRSLYDGFMD